MKRYLKRLSRKIFYTACGVAAVPVAVGVLEGVLEQNGTPMGGLANIALEYGPSILIGTGVGGVWFNG